MFPTLARLLFVNPFAPHIFAAIARRPGETRRFLERSTGSRIDQAGIDCYARLFGNAGHCAGAIRMMADWDLAPLAAGAADAGTAAAAASRRDGRRHPVRLRPAGRDRRRGARGMAARLGHLAHEERPDLAAAAIARFAATLGLSEAAMAG